jgi:drug/metabolite transporter (DMT)-like permease
LGAAEVPVKLASSGFSPFLISLGMVAGVFVARWTLPAVLKGSGYLLADIREKPHLIVWAILAGVLWAVANTLTVFAIRNIGLSIAFPLWNTNSIVGLIWGWLLFGELRDAGRSQWAKVLGGAAAIVVGACVLSYATSSQIGTAAGAPVAGVVAALGAGLLWGTMYIPYRKAYISGMNPLSFVTVFTFGELSAVLLLAVMLDGGWQHLYTELHSAEPSLFWLFLGGFCWVVGDLFQQYAAKYIGLGRGIPLSNTNQVWGLAWGVLVFGELAGRPSATRVLIIGGSLLTVLGACAIGLAEVRQSERILWRQALKRECKRYGLDEDRLMASLQGQDPLEKERPPRKWLELLVAVFALGIFLWLASLAHLPTVALDTRWMALLCSATVAVLVAGGLLLWRRTRFS